MNSGTRTYSSISIGSNVVVEQNENNNENDNPNPHFSFSGLDAAPGTALIRKRAEGRSHWVTGAWSECLLSFKPEGSTTQGPMIPSAYMRFLPVAGNSNRALAVKPSQAQ